MMSKSDRQINYGYLLGTVNLVRREIKSGSNPQAIVEAVSEVVFNEKLDGLLKEFNLK